MISFYLKLTTSTNILKSCMDEYLWTFKEVHENLVQKGLK